MMVRQNYQWPVKTMGTDYYPEHWDRKLWESDLDRMLEAGITVIRIAEFAWSTIEPEEGVFTFAFWDEFLNLCANKGMKVIFGTPTATPPAWLTENYPEVLNCDIDGNPLRHGGRRHYNYNSEIYRRFTERIVTEEARHYGQHPAIVGWQIDNELNCETNEFYSEADNVAFRAFLQDRYHTLEALNRAWGTVFWNQTYTDWSQVHVLRKVLNHGYNPHQHLDYLRFISWSCLRYARMQAHIIEAYKKPGDYITTNGLFAHLDNHTLAREILDVYTYDSYPNFMQSIDGPEGDNAAGAGHGSNSLRDRNWSLNLIKTRSICPHYGIMEQQSGPGGWTTRMEQATPRPGQLTLWAMQSVAHGADYIGFFRWRTATVGTEIYWHGILNYDNRDNRRLAEVKEFYHKLRTLDPVTGADYKGYYAVLQDYDNQFDAEVDHWHGRVERSSEQGIFVASQRLHTPYNVVNLADDYTLEECVAEELMGYPALFYPHPVITDARRMLVLDKYVSRGGTLVIGCRAGYKDMQGHCVMQPQPGPFARLTGTTVDDWSFALPDEEPIMAVTPDGQTMPMPVFNDVLAAGPETKVLAAYANGYFHGAPAITEHAYGNGRVIHLSSTFCSENVAWLLRYLGIADPLRDVITAPPEVEIAFQEKDGRQYLFVLNYMPTPQTITLHQSATLLYTGETVSGTITLPPYGTAVYAL